MKKNPFFYLVFQFLSFFGFLLWKKGNDWLHREDVVHEDVVLLDERFQNLLNLVRRNPVSLENVSFANVLQLDERLPSLDLEKEAGSVCLSCHGYGLCVCSFKNLMQINPFLKLDHRPKHPDGKRCTQLS